MKRGAVIYVAGHTGMVGSAIVRRLDGDGYGDLLLRTPDQLDLTDAAVVQDFFASKRPAYVFIAGDAEPPLAVPAPLHAAAGQLTPQRTILNAALRTGVSRVVCVARGGATELCEAYARSYGLECVCAVPADLYGPGDTFDLQTSHMVPSLIRQLHAARESRTERVVLWGTGKARREFLHVDDLAAAALCLMRSHTDPEPVYVGTGGDVSIHELAGMIAEIVGYPGGISFDPTRAGPPSTPLLDSAPLRALGWKPRIDLPAGIASTYRWYLESRALSIT